MRTWQALAQAQVLSSVTSPTSHFCFSTGVEPTGRYQCRFSVAHVAMRTGLYHVDLQVIENLKNKLKLRELEYKGLQLAWQQAAKGIQQDIVGEELFDVGCTMQRITCCIGYLKTQGAGNLTTYCVHSTSSSWSLNMFKASLSKANSHTSHHTFVEQANYHTAVSN